MENILMTNTQKHRPHPYGAKAEKRLQREAKKLLKNLDDEKKAIKHNIFGRALQLLITK